MFANNIFACHVRIIIFSYCLTTLEQLISELAGHFFVFEMVKKVSVDRFLCLRSVYAISNEKFHSSGFYDSTGESDIDSRIFVNVAAGNDYPEADYEISLEKFLCSWFSYSASE